MSFYGNVTYYLSNAFNKIIYRNAGSASGNNASTDSKASPGIPAYEYGLNPRNRKDEVVLETGNKWIVFADPSGTVENNQIKIFHQTIKENIADVTVSPATRAALENDTASTLDFGSIITLPTITYDNAGHIVSNDSVSYKMPTPQGEQEISQVQGQANYLSYLLTGDPNTNGEVPDPIPSNFHPYSYYIMQNRNNIGAWNIGQGTYQDNGTLADTIHELLYRIGLVTKSGNPDYPGENQSEYRYSWVNESDPNLKYRNGSILQIVSSADDIARVTLEYARANRRVLNQVVEAVNTAHGTTIEQLRED